MSDLRIVSEQLPPVDELASLWREFDRLGTHNFFLTWTWLGTWLQVLPHAVKPRLLKVMKGEVLVGLAMLTLRRCKMHGLIPVSQAHLNATGEPELDKLMIEHNGFASVHPASDELLHALVANFAAGAICADELVVPGVAPVLCGPKLIDAGKITPAFRTPLTGLQASEGIEPLLSSNARQQLRRSLRAAQRVGPINVEVAQDLSTALRFFANLKRLHITWWGRRGRPHAFSSVFFEKFHTALIANGIRDKNVDLLRVRAGDHVLGYLYNFRRNGKVSTYQTGFNDAAPGFRPGYVCHAVAMTHYANAGMSCYDFMAGANRLKQSFGVEQYELGWHQFRRKTTIFRIEAAMRKIRSVSR